MLRAEVISLDLKEPETGRFGVALDGSDEWAWSEDWKKEAPRVRPKAFVVREASAEGSEVQAIITDEGYEPIFRAYAPVLLGTELTLHFTREGGQAGGNRDSPGHVVMRLDAASPAPPLCVEVLNQNVERNLHALASREGEWQAVKPGESRRMLTESNAILEFSDGDSKCTASVGHLRPLRHHQVVLQGEVVASTRLAGGIDRLPEEAVEKERLDIALNKVKASGAVVKDLVVRAPHATVEGGARSWQKKGKEGECSLDQIDTLDAEVIPLPAWWHPGHRATLFTKEKLEKVIFEARDDHDRIIASTTVKIFPMIAKGGWAIMPDCHFNSVDGEEGKFAMDIAVRSRGKEGGNAENEWRVYPKEMSEALARDMLEMQQAMQAILFRGGDQRESKEVTGEVGESERERQLKEEARRLRNAANNAGDIEAQYAELQKAHAKLSWNFLQVQRDARRLQKARQTVAKQEQVIAKLRRLLESSASEREARQEAERRAEEAENRLEHALANPEQYMPQQQPNTEAPPGNDSTPEANEGQDQAAQAEDTPQEQSLDTDEFEGDAREGEQEGQEQKQEEMGYANDFED